MSAPSAIPARPGLSPTSVLAAPDGTVRS